MRYKIRFIIAILIVQALLALFIWSVVKNTDILEQPRVLALSNKNSLIRDQNIKTPATEIVCNINGEYNISCRKESDEVYVPFSFIKKYFDIYGKLVEKNGVEMFNWSHSYANIYYTNKKYDPRGVFTHFQSYKVEERERVKCITASEGVPLSTQWNSTGYYYPTQIAQYGLSHYSKSLIEPKSLKYVLENGEKIQADWFVSYGSVIQRNLDFDADTMVLCFKSNERKPITLKNSHKLQVVTFDLKLKPDNISEFIITIQNTNDKHIYDLHYTCGHQHITAVNDDIYYGLLCDGKQQWYKLSRDILIDVQKGIMLKYKIKPKLQRSFFKIESFSLKGEGCIDNLTIASSDHMTQFHLTANWFLKHQDAITGGWPNFVLRKMAGSLILQPGWYSAMGQGHGLSVLSRAYHLSSNKDTKYLEAGRKALNPFKTPSKNRGVLAMYMHELPWYEEYPTEPSTFVLNGFIYSLIGLYDFYMLAPANYSREPYMLYAQGMNSLHKLLMAFDTGSGTTYDLRHITLGIAPKLARWDYHATHINQLLLLSTIEKNSMFSITAKRWIGYMNGKRASHN